MACIHVEGFEYPGLSAAQLVEMGVLVGSGASPVAGGVLDPLGYPGLNGNIRLRVLAWGFADWRIPIPAISAGVVYFQAKQNGGTAIHSGQRWIGLRDTAGEYIFELVATSALNTGNGHSGAVRLLLGGVEVATGIPISLATWQHFAVVYDTSGSNVTSVVIYQNGSVIGSWSGTQAVSDVQGTSVGGSGVGPNLSAEWTLDTLAIWDDPVADLPASLRPLWCFGRTVTSPDTPSQGDWSSFLGATSPSGNINVQINAPQTDRGALTVTADSELVLGFSTLLTGVQDVLCVSVTVRMQGSATLTEGSLALRSGAVTTTPTIVNTMSITNIQQSAALDPDGGGPWTIPAVDALVVVVEATA